MKTLPLLLTLALSSPVMACEKTIHIGSAHIGDTSAFGQLNEQNLGLGVECGKLQLGIYKNSIYNTSVYVGSVLRYNRNLGIKYGLVSGYMKTIVPYAAAYIKGFGVEWTIIPATPYNPMTVGYSINF